MSFRMDGQATAALLHLELMLLDETVEPKALPLSLLESITNGFSTDREIGRGGYAVVYKGVLQNGTVAVKKLFFNIHMDENEFQREVQCLMKVKHKNIVRFLGYCADTQGNMAKYNGKLVMADVQQRLLCFEYLPKGNVHDYITDASSRLEWRTCYKIIKGICCGLHHLHDNHIVHLDLKPSNVLLDEHMVPKIADFGLSRCFEENQSQTITSKVVGSLGYFAPELYSGKITMKSDIYSVGILIIEMLTGEKGCPDVGNVLASWSGRLEKSHEDQQLEQVRVCTEIGIDCSDFNPAKRPVSLQNIVKRLKETETTDEESSDVPNAVSRKLFVHPRVLYFVSEPNKLSWSSVYLTNYTDEHVVFRLSEKEKQTYWFSFSTYVPLYGIVLPRSTHALALTMKEQEEQFSTLVLESAIFGGASSPKFLNPLSQDEWHEIFEEAKMNAKTVQRMILEAVATDQRDITSELKPPQTENLYLEQPFSGGCLDVNPDKKWIITGSSAGNVRIWDYQTQRKVDSFIVSTEKGTIFFTSLFFFSFCLVFVLFCDHIPRWL
nr:cysteine-rich receptor-like protein kinase 28 isoform X2 [Lolium perenne]